MLRSIEWISTHRTRSYRFAEFPADAEIYMVDGGDAQALTQWAAARRRAPAPSIVLSSEGNPVLGHRGFKRPIIASKLMAMLDEITAQELGFMPELIIGKDGAPDADTVSVAASVDQIRGLALVVDDSPTVRKQIELGLKLAGYAVESAETAEAAMKLLANRNYDIVFLDVVLPGADGYQVCKAIKRDRAKKHIPVIMLTGKSSPLDFVRGSLAGCNSYLTKPVQNSVFQEVIRKFGGGADANHGPQARAV
ncbi:MAG TPA: response regulator [Gammaproteobacteria bacterium]|nr:response regulator [Gammaproteobacteria bacterium]